MIKVENLSYSFPGKDLYNKISFSIEGSNHCAFIGTSGSGKSTLINMIMNPDDYMYDGLLDIDPAIRVGYVSQFSELDASNKITVFEYIAKDFIALEKEIADICTQMESGEDIEILLEKYQEALDAFDAIGGDDYASKIMKKLAIANLDYIKDSFVTELSGGEFKLVQIIKEMLGAPNLLIMDEPDVFLDFDNLNSLKNLINTYKDMLLVVTHNRYLLNHCFNKILHLENCDLQEYEGPYMEYNMALLQNKIELQEQAVKDEEEIERYDKIITELRKIATYNSEASRGKALKARVKFQERLMENKTIAPFVEIKQPKIELLANERNEEDVVLSINGYSVAFDDTLLEDVTFEIKAHEKVAIVGANGTGKTTLLRDIFTRKSELIKLGDDVKVAYLSQNHDEVLNEENTILEEFIQLDFDSFQKIKNYLSNYGFSGDIFNQKIGSLSGGEKNLLQMAKIATKSTDLLLLDEPTSHMDTYSQISVENAIERYEGAVLMISHDYYTIVNSMDYILFIDDKSIRRMSMRKFRQKIYSLHFDKDYLEFEHKKKGIVTKIELSLKNMDFEKSKVYFEELENLVSAM